MRCHARSRPPGPRRLEFQTTDDHITAERGQIIAKPGSLRAHLRFDAVVYTLTPAEGGRLMPITDGYRPYLGMRTASVTATFTFPHPTDSVRPEETASAHIRLLGPVGMAPGLTFEIREAGRVVGYGIVTRVL